MAVIIEDKNTREQQGASSFPGRKICVTLITELSSCFKISYLLLFQGRKNLEGEFMLQHFTTFAWLLLFTFIALKSEWIAFYPIYLKHSEPHIWQYLTIGKTPLRLKTELNMPLWWHTLIKCVCVTVGSKCIPASHPLPSVLLKDTACNDTTLIILTHMQPSGFLICLLIYLYACAEVSHEDSLESKGICV